MDQNYSKNTRFKKWNFGPFLVHFSLFFKTNFDFTIEQTKEIVSYMKKMQKKYKGVLVNIQPSEQSVNNDFDKKIELFVKSNFEIVARSNVVKDKLEQHFLFDNMHFTLQI